MLEYNDLLLNKQGLRKMLGNYLNILKGEGSTNL